MTTLAFDTLRYARRLKEVGVPEPQAEVQAELMAEAFGFYADNLLTIDHFTEVLDARFAEQDAKLEQRIAALDSRTERSITALDSKFEQRFAALDSKIEHSIAALDSKFEQRIAALDSKIERSTAALDSKIERSTAALDSKFEQRFGKQDAVNRLHTWMLGLITLVLVVPQFQAWLA